MALVSASRLAWGWRRASQAELATRGAHQTRSIRTLQQGEVNTPFVFEFSLPRMMAPFGAESTDSSLTRVVMIEELMRSTIISRV